MKLPLSRAIKSGLVFLVLGIGSLGLFWSFKSVFAVKSINCTATSGKSCSELQLTQLATLINTPFFGVDWPALLSTILSSQADTVVDYRLIFPNQLDLVLKSDQPAYRVKFGDKLLTIGESGNTIVLDGTNYPVINIDQKIQEQVIYHNSINIKYHQVFQQLTHVFPRLGTYVLNSRHRLEIVTPDKTYVVNPQQPVTHIIQLLSYAQQIEWNTITAPIVEVDLRYREPVLRSVNTTAP